MSTSLPACDTSVLVPAFASWHDHHEVARATLVGGLVVPASVLVETYSVLTRLPAPYRMPAGAVAPFLRRASAGGVLALPPEAHLDGMERLASLGIDGGRAYDAMIALTVLHHGRTLVSLDQRAAVTYCTLGCPYRILA
jgi:predicted nucleic acid-binding protein